jgi:tetratricopeptide (TPR) repeat protein
MRLSKNGWLLAITILIIAVSLITNKVQAQGTSADQYVAAGQQLLTAHNYTQAAQYYYAAVKIDPSNAAAYQGLGTCYYMGGRKSDALTFYQRALSLQPSNAQLAQFVQGLQAQLNPAMGTPGTMGLASDPLTQGSTLFQQKQYAASIPYFQRAAQQNPNDYRAFYYAGYAYYMTGNGRFAALYFAVANTKQPNASIQAYADRVKASLSPDDQQWVDDQLSKYSSSTGGGSGNSQVAFGFNFLGGSTYIFSNPSQIINGAENAMSVSISGTTPNMVAVIGVEPYLEFGQNFELDLGATYIPVGSLSYLWLSPYQPVQDGNGNTITTAGGTPVYGYNDNFASSMVMAELGLKVKFGDSHVKGYVGLGMNIAPVSTTFTKLPTDDLGNTITGGVEDLSSGTYTTVAFGGYARFGVDFYLSKTMAIGPFVGVQILTATNFQNGSKTLVVNQNNGDVGVANSGALVGVTNTTPLTLDYSNVNLGMEMKFSF